MSKPQLALLPDRKPVRIVVGTTIRKPAAVLRHWLASLAWQELPPNTTLTPVFALDGVDEEAFNLLKPWVEAHGGEFIVQNGNAATPDFADVGAPTHQWTPTAMERVGAAKDAILARARALDADYVWFCDADLICDRTTLQSLLSTGSPIATAVYWTRWHAGGTETRKIHAAPQVWLRHPYTLSHGGLAEHEFRDRLARRQLTRVAGYGACTLIDRRALGAGVAFARVPGVPLDGMMAGEDRHFCIRAQGLHLDAVADPWPDVFHIYHLPADLAHAPDYAARLNVEHPKQPLLGDLVSLTIQPIEPIPWQGGGWTAIPPQRLRGRLGALNLVPELEEAVASLKRGDTVTVPVHFPAHYGVPYLQGRRRLIRVTLHDCKRNGWAPVLESEILAGPRSGAAIRTVDYTTNQLDGMREIANG